MLAGSGLTLVEAPAKPRRGYWDFNTRFRD